MGERDQELRIILGYIGCLRLAWGIQDPCGGKRNVRSTWEMARFVKGSLPRCENLSSDPPNLHKKKGMLTSPCNASLGKAETWIPGLSGQVVLPNQSASCLRKALSQEKESWKTIRDPWHQTGHLHISLFLTPPHTQYGRLSTVSFNPDFRQ